MRDFRKQRSISHDIFNFFALCAGVLLVLGLTVFSVQAAWGMYTKFVVASKGHDAAKKELSQLEVQYARVSVAVDNLSTERGEEGEIRSRFGVARPGEGAIQIVRNGTSSDGGQNMLKESLWGRIFRAVFVW
jgi:hypothetical protein